MIECFDYFHKNAAELTRKKLFLFDLDGTIYEENNLFDGALELLNLITQNDGRYVFITNNSSKSVTDYIDKVNRLGITASENNFFTSAQATILYIEKNYPGCTVYCQGTYSLIQELKNAGINVVTEAIPKVDIVLVGFDTELTSEKIRKTCELLQRDVVFLATNPDLACPVSFGFIPDCGSICGMLKNATGKDPIYIGKPEPTMVNIVAEKYGYEADEICVIGDRLYTDIATGNNAGVTSICVLTGEATERDIIEGNIKPSYTFASIKELFDVINRLHEDCSGQAFCNTTT